MQHRTKPEKSDFGHNPFLTAQPHSDQTMRRSRRLRSQDVVDDGAAEDEAKEPSSEEESGAASESESSTGSDSDSDEEMDAADQLAGMDLLAYSRKSGAGSVSRSTDESEDAVREATRLLQMPLLPQLPGASSSVAGSKVDGYLRETDALT